MDSAICIILVSCLLGRVLSAPLQDTDSSDNNNEQNDFFGEDDFYSLMTKANEEQNDFFGEDDFYSLMTKANEGSRVRRVQGDIAVRVSRSTIVCTDCFWQKSNGIVYVPYTLDKQYSSDQINTITSAMEVYSTLTCVQFVPYTDEEDYIAITSGDGCWSFMGRQGGAQVVSVEKGYCTSEGTTMHELNHALGFVHEHSRSDRDNYVNIMYQYISSGDDVNFEKMETNNLDTTYDYRSIMHYPAWAFSNTTGQNTIVAKPNPNVTIGAGNTMTSLDIIKINRLYECDVCSSFLTDANGTVTSANYPSAYPNNAKCVWVIQAPSDLVTLTFAAFNLQSAPNCASDYIRVYDGRTRTSPLLLDRTCGSKRVPALIASSSMMLVEFVGSKNLKATGFSASYSTVKCGGTYFTPSRNITSPGYPKNYPPNSNCSYIITAPASHKVSLSKISFYTQNSHTCSNDYLSVYDGTSTNAPLLKTFCGPLFTLSATSTGQNMFLRFISDQTEQAPGFVLTYSFVPIS
uniref:Metalloendopeptidase n=1 Tax=Xenopus tropicalis TaxID=8364 RepID=A0A6I8S8W3_XENTR